MSFLTKSLEKRIQELRVSIEAQSTELAAYEQVLALESGKPADSGISAPSATPSIIHHLAAPAHKAAAKSSAVKRSAAAPSAAKPLNVEFKGSRSDFVQDMLRESGANGIAPAEISAAFVAKKVAVSKNLVYNVLSLMFKNKRARKSGGRYYLIAGNNPAPMVTKTAPAGAPKKRRISEEGMKRIIAATKKRWALQRAKKAK